MPSQEHRQYEISNQRGVAEAEQGNTPDTIELGYPVEDSKIPSQYKVVIRSDNEGANGSNFVEVHSVLQEQFSMRVGSRWESLVGSGGLPLLETLAQAGFGKTTVMPWMSRRKWQGTSPLEISLNLKLEAFTDAEKEVVAPCRFLQQIAIPGYRTDSAALTLTAKASGVYLLTPPGPNPYPWKRGEIITIEVGDFLTFDKVVPVSVDVKFDPKFTEDGGLPVSAVVSLQFETDEILTKEKVTEIYGGTKVNAQGCVERDKNFR